MAQPLQPSEPVLPGDLNVPDEHTGPPPGVEAPAVPGEAALPTAPRTRGLRAPQFLLLLWDNPKARIGLIVLAIMILLAVFAPLIARYNPSDMVSLPQLPPSGDHWFGTNQQGQDIFAQVLYGARASLLVAGSAAALATLISAAVGMIAAYVGGIVDDAITLLMNIFLVIPTLPLLIVIASYVPSKGAVEMILIIAFTTWAGEARVLRSQALSLRSLDFIMAAKTTGESVWRIVFGEIMPNMTSRIAAGFVFSFVGAILYEAGLEFLGFGNPNNITWGNTLFWAENNATLESGAWWHFTFPGLAIAITASALIFINYGIDEISNPRLRRVKVPKAEKIDADREPRRTDLVTAS